MTCAGCGGVVAYVCQDNDSIGVCIFCRPILPDIRWTRPEIRSAPRLARGTCSGCGGPVFHGGFVCPMCRGEVLTGIFRLNADLLDENPFVYAMVLPQIRFTDGLNLSHRTNGDDHYGFYPIGDEWRVVRFDRLAKEKENSA